ncbi:hypothetical protein CO2235_190076 [Cupriavidus oxalaticus]|uniref:Uncharacterized protein n=1 Tax=Cupriavidus oxalaticus TaxID=96344 RepID=A0A976BC50_9BURK|nr:hypothetical protein CO2235_190076 [Cupriavidus oxalaticus]
MRHALSLKVTKMDDEGLGLDGVVATRSSLLIGDAAHHGSVFEFNGVRHRRKDFACIVVLENELLVVIAIAIRAIRTIRGRLSACAFAINLNGKVHLRVNYDGARLASAIDARTAHQHLFSIYVEGGITVVLDRTAHLACRAGRIVPFDTNGRVMVEHTAASSYERSACTGVVAILQRKAHISHASSPVSTQGIGPYQGAGSDGRM